LSSKVDTIFELSVVCLFIVNGNVTENCKQIQTTEHNPHNFVNNIKFCD